MKIPKIYCFLMFLLVGGCSQFLVGATADPKERKQKKIPTPHENPQNYLLLQKLDVLDMYSHWGEPRKFNDDEEELQDETKMDAWSMNGDSEIFNLQDETRSLLTRFLLEMTAWSMKDDSEIFNLQEKARSLFTWLVIEKNQIAQEQVVCRDGLLNQFRNNKKAAVASVDVASDDLVELSRKILVPEQMKKRDTFEILEQQHREAILQHEKREFEVILQSVDPDIPCIVVRSPSRSDDLNSLNNNPCSIRSSNGSSDRSSPVAVDNNSSDRYSPVDNNLPELPTTLPEQPKASCGCGCAVS